MRVLGLALTLALDGWILAGCASQGGPGAGELSFTVVKVYGGNGWIGKENRVPSDILIDEKEGSFYVVEWRDSYVKKFRMDGTFIDWLGESNAWDKTFSLPYGIAAGDGDHLFLTLDGESTVFVMTRAGQKVKALFQAGSGPGDLNRPKGIARSPKNGWFYVVDRYNFRVQYFDADGNVKGQWGSQGSRPGEFYLARGIAIDAGGDVYVADTYNHRVQVFTADGKFLRAFGATAGEGEAVDGGAVCGCSPKGDSTSADSV